ncbi:putative multiple-sugar transport system permease YteP [Paenibacillus sp. J31TS4]|uniref:ABC transporter permease n=1 Tax=Paenibacillus sp. J31TS4 TaxID=2807195 RepID=UPI001B028A42|nr:ABC transporter permease subunit [Paenibacillus sp. J31TS4]GIP40860.1 putative multiple-sugar transport system permease YteP [Paenibacillus sp. J31TS4]
MSMASTPRENLPAPRAAARRRGRLARNLWKSRYMYAFVLPGLLYFLLYRYVPLLGSILAFKEYSPFQGILDSPWVGLANFRRIFENAEVVQVLVNTLVLSFLQILFAFPVPIVLAVMLNEVRSDAFKKLIQSIVYLPHFLSWVVVIGIVTVFLRSEGLVNLLLERLFGISSIPFLQLPALFKPLLVLEVIWKESGWGTIVFLAALAGVHPELYEAAVVDGAGRLRRIWHITLPAIRSTVVILLILRLGTVLDNGFEQVFLMLNPYVMNVGNVLDTYVYYKGILQSDFSFATAVGLFKSLVGLVLVVAANRLAKRFGEEGIY